MNPNEFLGDELPSDDTDHELRELIDSALKGIDLGQLPELPEEGGEDVSMGFKFIFYIDPKTYQVSTHLLMPLMGKIAYLVFDPSTTMMLLHNIAQYLRIGDEVKRYAAQGYSFQEALAKIGIDYQVREGDFPDEDSEGPEAEGL